MARWRRISGVKQLPPPGRAKPAAWHGPLSSSFERNGMHRITEKRHCFEGPFVLMHAARCTPIENGHLYAFNHMFVIEHLGSVCVCIISVLSGE